MIYTLSLVAIQLGCEHKCVVCVVCMCDRETERDRETCRETAGELEGRRETDLEF
jgi:hypothetical protein